MKRLVLVATVVLSAAAAHASVAPIVANSSFDSITDGSADGWKISGGCLVVERGAGVNGSGGAVWRSDVPTRQCGIYQNIKLEAGKAYRFDGLMRTEGFKGSASLCVEWVDKDGKFLSGSYSGGVNQSTSDWVKVFGSTRDIPTNAAAFTVMFYVRKGATGKIVFDNVNVAPLERDPVAYVISSRYRDRAAKGKVEFCAALFPPDGAEDLKAFFSWTDASGSRRRRAADVVSPEGASISLDAEGFPMGGSEVSCELFAGKKRLGSAACRFERVERLPDLRVWIDRHGRCIVGGRPMFPLGMYTGKFDAEKLAVYRKGPFNCVMPYGYTTLEEMDAAWAAGIMAFVNLKDCTLGSTWAKRNKFTTQEEVDAWLKGRIDHYRKHPGLLGWYLNDESPLTEVPMRLHHYRLFREADPQHPVWIVIARAYDLREFAPTADVMGVDPYPVPSRPMKYISEFQRDAVKRVFGTRSFWNVPQCFNWGWYRTDVLNGRFPSIPEMRSMCWQHIACGANGLIAYVFGLGEKFLAHWGEVCDVFSEVKKMEGVLLSVEECPGISASTDALSARAWVKDGDLYVLACNTLETRLEASVAISGGEWRVAGAELGDAGTMDGPRTIRFSLPPIGVSVTRLTGRQSGGGLETAKWQAAIDAAAAAGGGVVSVPAGVHPVGQLDLRSNVELRLEKGAVLEGAAGMENYRVVELPYSEGTWSAVVAGFGVTNVAITGEGEINGRGERFSMDFRNAPRGVCREGLRPRGVVFADSAGIRLEGFTLRDAACWGIVFKCCDGVVARRVTIDSHAHENNDGFDVEAKNVIIEDCDVDGGDDGVCIKSNNPGFAVENVVVRRCVSRSHCNGYKLGTASHGTMRNIRFENCRADFPRRDFVDRTPGREGRKACARAGYEECPNGVGISAICVECVDGGTVEGVVFDGVDLDGYMVPLFVRGGSRTGRKCGIPPSDRFVLRDITIRNVRGRALSRIPSSVSGVDVCRPRNVLLENVDIVCRGEGRNESTSYDTPGPEFAGCYPEATMYRKLRLPAFGLFVDRADGVVLRNARFSLAPGEVDCRQPVFMTSEVRGS